MAGQLLLNIGIVLLLIVIEGVFVAAEISLVSLRDQQVRAMAETGRRGSIVAKLVSDPNRFLAAVQIGVTTTALLSSAFGAVTISDEVKDFLVENGWGPGLAKTVGVVGVTLIITYVTLVVGELAPKRLALQRTERSASLFAPPLNRIASIFRPVIWLLSKSTNGLVRILGGDPAAGREPISEEELRGLVAAHESLSSDERRLIDDVFAAGERSVGEIMVPRTEVVFLEANMTVSKAAKLAATDPHERYATLVLFVAMGVSYMGILGFVHIRDLLLGDPRTMRDRTVGSLAREVKVIPGTKRVLKALSEMRREGNHLAIVVDEYGGTDGIVTLEDLVEEIVGDISEEGGRPAEDELRGLEVRHPALGERLLVRGVEESSDPSSEEGPAKVAEISGLELPEGPYATLGGYVMAELGRLPQLNDRLMHAGFQLDVIEVDGRRAARVRVTPPQPPEDTAEGAESTDRSVATG